MKGKKCIYVFVTLFVTLLTGCHYDDDDYYDRLPWEIQKFIIQYYPNPTVDAVTESTDGWYVGLKSGPGFNFDTACQWTDVNGYGTTLPVVFVFDQFPEKLYDYLEETENTDNVFAVSRTPKEYRVRLLKSYLTYTINTETVTSELARQVTQNDSY